MDAFSDHATPGLRVADADAGQPRMTEAMARLLVDGFTEVAPDAWPTMEAARQEVCEAFEPERIALVAVDEDGRVTGWIGAQPAYHGKCWELHPLVVAPDARRRGVGRALVLALEERVRERGGATLFLGTDDETGLTSLGGADLFPDVLARLGEIRNVRGHPYEFYQRLGYVIVGCIPDANGFGKPDIFMAKRLARP